MYQVTMLSPHINTMSPPVDKNGAKPNVAPNRDSFGNVWLLFMQRMIKIPITAGVSNAKDMKKASSTFGMPQIDPIATLSLTSPAPNWDLGAIQIRKNSVKPTLAPITLFNNPCSRRIAPPM